jgi:hypothetical protein
MRFLLLSFLFQSFMVTGALGAAVSAIAAADHQRIQVCTSSGISWIDISDHSQTPSSKHSSSGHCNFCGAVALALNSDPGLFKHTGPIAFPPVSIPGNQAEPKRLSFQFPPSQASPALI